jgi:DMSO/TMAO reductase YedYZ molybdopterin-dependent catalytic subunit
LRRAATALPLVAGLPTTNLARVRSGADHSAQAATPATLIVREKEPENLEFPFQILDRFLTPNEQFYTRCHFPIPKVEVASWRLKVEGAVERPLELTHAELLQLPTRSAPVLLECAGNGRSFLVPKAKGVPWELGAVNTAEWTGVPLAVLLQKAGLRDTAVDVVLEGADAGELKTEPRPAGKIHFARSLPVTKARQPEVLLAYRMNGRVLPAAHGFPLRAVVPGWYGMASIKWLQRIVVTDRPFTGFFQSIDYSYFERRQGFPSVVPITELQVKAEIARPARDEQIKPDIPYRVHGAAWTGDSEVTRVEISTDGGSHWTDARLVGKRERFTWRFWEYSWHTPAQAGRHHLMARATDQRGRVQPMEHDPDRRNYMISHVVPVEVEVG